MDIAEVLAVVREKMANAYASFEGGIESIMLSANSPQKDGHYRPLSSSGNYMTERSRALGLVEELQQATRIGLHNIRCLGEAAVEEMYDEESLVDRESAGETEQLRRLCLEYETCVEKRVNECRNLLS